MFPSRISWFSRLFGCAIAALMIVGIIVALDPDDEQDAQPPRAMQIGNVVNWWDPPPKELTEASTHSDSSSNIAPDDYVGPDACVKCHPKQHGAWARHPHRWMNSLAQSATVKGDFAGRAAISYMGGTARFYQDGNDGYRMELERGDVRRVYKVAQTIGSRFFQYYVGHLLQGPEPKGHLGYSVDHVLPFGYWLDREQWVPTVHVHWARLGEENVDEECLPFEQRHDPFAAPHDGFSMSWYTGCNQCHTTMPLGDLLVRNPDVLGRHAPAALHFAAPEYLSKAHPELRIPWDDPYGISDKHVDRVIKASFDWDARQHAASLGVTCEACHLGSREHAEGRLKRPRFFPQSPHLYIFAEDGLKQWDHGRTHANLNWACGRCHSGGRRTLAGGMATWNSTEYTDAMRGSCYSQLRCVDCHNPHEPTGQQWRRTPDQDDASCLRCHQEFQRPSAMQAHTHHAPGSAGSHCMDCHMPRLNEGLQDVVRTHMIYSPTQKEMIEANHPNACNQCHVDKPIDWTLDHLSLWYGKQYSKSAIDTNYPNRDGPAALGWMASRDHSVRLLAVDALTRTNSKWAMPKVIACLDDPFLVNRQFAQIGVEKVLGRPLSEFGYRFYMTKAERADSIKAIREFVATRIAISE